MSKRFLKPMMAMVIVALLGYGCAGTDNTSSTNTGTTDSTGMADASATETTDDMAGTDPTDATMDTNTGTDNMGNTGMANTGDSLETETVANRSVGVEEMFEDVENTEQYDIMALARMYDNLSTFVQLVESAGLEQSLNAGGGKLTFFIPTNEAFEQLPKERYDQLTDPNNRAELMRVLNLHVYRTELPATQFSGRQVLDLGNGNQVTVNTDNPAGATGAAQSANITIGGANVVKSDIRASNGIIHLIDGVISTDSDLDTGTVNDTGTDSGGNGTDTDTDTGTDTGGE